MPTAYYLLDKHARAASAFWDHSMTCVRPVAVCPVNSQHLIGGRRNRRNRGLRILLPRQRHYDTYWTQYSECVLTERLKGLMEDASITGVEFEPVRVAGSYKPPRYPDPEEVLPPPDQPPSLWELRNVGWGGLVAGSSRISIKERCPGCGRETWEALSDGGIDIDSSAPPHEDIFMLWPMPVSIFVSKRVADLLKKHRITGAVCRPLTDITIKRGDGYAPGKLEYWMSHEAAKAREDAMSLRRERHLPRH